MGLLRHIFNLLNLILSLFTFVVLILNCSTFFSALAIALLTLHFLFSMMLNLRSLQENRPKMPIFDLLMAIFNIIPLFLASFGVTMHITRYNEPWSLPFLAQCLVFHLLALFIGILVSISACFSHMKYMRLQKALAATYCQCERASLQRKQKPPVYLARICQCLLAFLNCDCRRQKSSKIHSSTSIFPDIRGLSKEMSSSELVVQMVRPFSDPMCFRVKRETSKNLSFLLHQSEPSQVVKHIHPDQSESGKINHTHEKIQKSERLQIESLDYWAQISYSRANLKHCLHTKLQIQEKMDEFRKSGTYQELALIRKALSRYQLKFTENATEQNKQLREEHKKVLKHVPQICTICVEGIEKGEGIVLLPVCKHMFHRECHITYCSFRKQDVCAICQSSANGAVFLQSP